MWHKIIAKSLLWFISVLSLLRSLGLALVAREAEFKADGIIDLAEEILRQSSTQAVVF